MHQNGLTLTATGQHLFRQWGVLLLFIVHAHCRGLRAALHWRPSASWFTSGIAAFLPRDTANWKLSFYGARAVWLQNPLSWLQHYSTFTWLRCSFWKRLCEHLHFLNRALPRRSLHLPDLPAGFKISLNRSQNQARWSCWASPLSSPGAPLCHLLISPTPGLRASLSPCPLPLPRFPVVTVTGASANCTRCRWQLLEPQK